ncbi:MAG: hypothetical protein BWY81_00174 [Firmicutes bacterium ADurb.Bin467]|nr:MAG: hypothetical protein BWY81_00174 [Firmicutes bacterium ADurb.Bin467]
MPWFAITCAPRWLMPAPWPQRRNTMLNAESVCSTQTVSLSFVLMPSEYQLSSAP